MYGYGVSDWTRKRTFPHWQDPSSRMAGTSFVRFTSPRRAPQIDLSGPRTVDRKAPMAQQRRPMRVLVTGGAGFIGSHLAEALLARGERGRVVDNLSTGPPP